MKTTEVELSKLKPPPTRDIADSAKLLRMGAFDWRKYSPIIVERDGTVFIIQEGLTRGEAARRAGILRLPAYVFAKSGG